MPPRKRIFTPDQLREIGVPNKLSKDIAVADVHQANTYRAEIRTSLFRYEGAIWAVEYQRPLTNYQGFSNHGWLSTVTAWEMQPVQTVVTRWIVAGEPAQAHEASNAWQVEIHHPVAGWRPQPPSHDNRDDALHLLHWHRETRSEMEVRLIRATTTYVVERVSP